MDATDVREVISHQPVARIVSCHAPPPTLDMISWHRAPGRVPERTPPSSVRLERVILARFTENLRPLWYTTVTIEGYIDDEVLVRFGDVVVQVPAEMLVQEEDR